jgi:hypothetical protein
MAMENAQINLIDKMPMSELLAKAHLSGNQLVAIANK